MAIQFYQVDAFTNEPFKGNPAAVCILPERKDDSWMQHIAAEMNLSETAFLCREGNGYSLRWFTPVAEVDLCGHATLASAHILYEHQYLDADTEATFFTKSGLLSARKRGEWIEMNFPTEPAVESNHSIELFDGLGISDAVYVGRNRFDYLIEVESDEIVKSLQPDWNRLSQIETRGIIVTSDSSSADVDFVSRAFFPAIGVNEDPVTGSAHCCLGPYWQKKLKKDELIAYQASARGGFIQVQIQNDRVILSGQAITVMEGKILL